MRKKVLGIIMAICLVISICALVACGGGKPQAEEGTIYQTEVKSFWVGVGHAYMQFDYKEEPEQKEEGDNNLYGYVFSVQVDAGDGYSAWLSGNWNLKETNGTYGDLILTATWEDGENATSLADAQSGVAKTYSLTEGKYTIGVNLPSAGKIDFTLDPTKKLNNGGTVTPPKPTECTQHVDENSDGKCDVCGEDMPAQEKVEQTLTAKCGTLSAKIELLGDKTWNLSVSYYEGGDFNKTVSGTWVMDPTTYYITLTITNDQADVLAENEYTLVVNYETFKYSATLECNLPQVGTNSFEFISADAEQGGEADVQMALHAADQGMTAELALMSDNTFSLGISYYEGMAYQPVASGTWAFDASYNIVLTVTKDDGEVLANENYTLTVDYTTHDYSGLIVCTVPTIGDRNFNFSSATVSEDHFTVSFDLNYDGAPTIDSLVTETFTFNDNGTNIEKEYVKSAPAVPQRQGYHFAGWYRSANPTLQNGASDEEYIFGQKISGFAVVSIPNDVCEITEDATLYARWVEKVEITDEAGLKAMANDLTGWYSLSQDITLTEAWTPIGKYYANYESYEPVWWKYAFRGRLDGNNHKINGLSITTLDLQDDEISAVEGSAKGTVALFGSAVNCKVTNLTISGANIDLTYAGTTHAYVSVLAGFVQGTATLFENCKVEAASINVNLTNSWYYAVAGLFAGHWGGNANNCSVVNSTITLNVTSTANVEGHTSEVAHVGGLVGEGYAWLNGCTSDVDINYTLNDSRSAEVATIDAYVGGANATSTYINGVSYEGAITVNFTKAVGNINFYLGGLSGYQRYGYIMNSSAKASMTFNNHNASVVEGQKFVAGGILGANDVMYGLMGAAYFAIPNGCRVSNCLDMSTMTTTGTAVFAETLAIIGYVPEDYMVDAYNSQFNVDLTSFKRADNTYTFFGAFNCVRLTGTASAADVDGNITVADISALQGEAVKSVLGENWTYAEGQLPTPKTVA